MTAEEQEFIKTKLSSKLWRLDNLYHIRDKQGVLRVMRLNDAQRKVLTKFKHNKKIILKSRQQGISTLYLAYYLDSCLFTEGYSAGIQSVGQDEADKLSQRAELMWDYLRSDVKELLGLKMIANNAKGMRFSNGSILKVGNFRGDTLQGLHVSELGKIAKKYPEKAKELKTGAFQAVATSSKITIESTAEGRTGLFYDMWNQAEAIALQGKDLTPLDFQAIFLSWLEDGDCTLDHEVPLQEEDIDYFKALEAQLHITLTDQQKWWYAKKRQELGDDMTQEYPATAEEAFMVARDGSYYGKMYRDHILANKRLVKNLYDDNIDVSVAFDLGMRDTMVAVFYQKFNREVRIIDEYHNTGESIQHYCKMLEEKKQRYGYNYDAIWLPHDGKVVELGTGKSRQEVFRDFGVHTRILKKIDVPTGIELVRKWIPNMYVAEHLYYIQDTFINYSKEWDDKLGQWKQKPLHDEWSNPADAIRYMCLSLREDAHRFANKQQYRPRKISGFAI